MNRFSASPARLADAGDDDAFVTGWNYLDITLSPTVSHLHHSGIKAFHSITGSKDTLRYEPQAGKIGCYAGSHLPVYWN